MNKETQQARSLANKAKAAYMAALENGADDECRNALVKWYATEREYSELASIEVMQGTMTMEQAINA